MPKIAALFSGQGAQYPGMGKELYENFAAARDIYTCAGDILGFDVAKTSFEGTEQEMTATKVAQPLIFTLSLAAFAAAKQVLPPPAAVAGHSLGEYAALCCAGAFSIADGMRIIGERAAAMEEAATGAKGAMYAIVGSTEEAVEGFCSQAAAQMQGLVQPVNFNMPGQTVISGEEQAAAKAAELAAAAGAKAVRLAVGSAFHTAMMQPAAARLKQALAGIAFAPVAIPFYSNLTGQRLEVADYPAYFAEHMVSPVLFTKQMTALAEAGVELCVEFGPKKTAATFAKKNNRAFQVANVEDLKTLEKAKRLFD